MDFEDRQEKEREEASLNNVIGNQESARRQLEHDAGEPLRKHRIARGTEHDQDVFRFKERCQKAKAIPGNGLWHSSWKSKWGRRSISISGVLVAIAVHGMLFPLLLLGSLCIDLWRRKGLLLVRFHVVFFCVLAWHVVGLVGLLWLWLFNYRDAQEENETWIEKNKRLETFWINEMIGLAELVYGSRFEIEGLEELNEGPYFVFSRHASVIDAILPNQILGKAHNLVVRSVIKSELLMDPCVDVVCHRIPRAFVKRGTGSHEQEIEKMIPILGQADSNDAIVVFPEGTRFTEKKKERIYEKLSSSKPEIAKLSAHFQKTLPPRPAGIFALMDARPDMDVVFCAHTGLEGTSRLEDLVGGALLRRTIKVHFWRVRAEMIPYEKSERLAWLYDWWGVIDNWIIENET